MEEGSVVVRPAAFDIMDMRGDTTGAPGRTAAGVTGSFWKEIIPKLNLEG